jgi:Kdo2-lipid IVA lauroyltransferase/acyltransferase
MSASGLWRYLRDCALRAAGAASTLLPPGAVRWVGQCLGVVGYPLAWSRRKRMLEQLSAVFPERDLAHRRRIAKLCFRACRARSADNLTMTRASLVGFCTRLSIEGWEHLQAAQQMGHGLLVLVTRLGAWQVATWAIGTYVGPSYVTGLPFENGMLAGDYSRTALRFKVETAEDQEASRTLEMALQRGGTVISVIDTPAALGAGSVAVPFLGGVLAASPVPARLALKYRSPAVPISAVPMPRGCHRLTIQPPLYPPSAVEVVSSAALAGVADLTARYVSSFEAEIRRSPELWPWGDLASRQSVAGYPGGGAQSDHANPRG